MAEVFSLEDDYGDLFITQSDNNLNVDSSQNYKNEEESGILSDPFDFSSPCVSMISKQKEPQYSDISDAEDFEIPSSQKHGLDENEKKR